MKKYIFLSFFCFAIISASGQQKTTFTLSNVVEAFNLKLKDSLYKMMSPQMKSALGKEGSDKLFGQLMDQLGKVTDTKASSTAGADLQRYILEFERPLVNILLVMKDGEIAGIRQVARTALSPGSTRVESADNYTLGEGTATLYATLVLPKKSTEKVPVVLMIGGSGPTDRNMNQGDALVTNSFAMLADTLAQNGIATLRYDKRGVGKSMQALKTDQPTMDDYADDASAFMNKLKMDERFSKIIILGHSEGSSIGIIAALKSQPAGLICLSGYDSDLGSVLEVQLSKNLDTADLKLAKTVIHSLKNGNTYQGELSPAISNLFSTSTQQYIISAMRHNAAMELKKIKVPILVISGGTDLQVGTESGKKLAMANRKAKFVPISGMNHVLKNAPLDREVNLKSYTDGKLPINAELGKEITAFIKALK